MNEIRKTIIIEAPPEVVWDYLTTKDKVSTWFNDLQADMVEGEDWCMRTGTSEPRGRMWGKVLEAKVPERLVYSFDHQWMNHNTLVTWELKPVSEGTALTLTHPALKVPRMLKN